jgi:hypothetical protein
MHYRVGKAIIRFRQVSAPSPSGRRAWKYMGTVTVPNAILVVGSGGAVTERSIVWMFTLDSEREMSEEEVVRWAIEYGSSLNGDLPRSPTIAEAASIEEATQGATEVEFVLDG